MTEESVFAAAITIADPAAREAYLDAACGGDATLRARLGALVAAHFAAHPLLDPPAAGTRTFADAAPTADPDGTRDRPGPAGAAGAVIAGRYKLLQRVGEGGMGEVWMAEQTEPVRRRVAVKLIRAERGTSKAILARFAAERQAIALMDHPHIAKLLDAGTTDAGGPFFAMELVKGVPITQFCDQHRLTVPERLALFQQVCSAVQHAHQKGVIHRDLKPGNILVESHDGRPVPKVIDFGLAKATTGLPLTEHTLFTAFGSVMGTPTYMAPEQASFNAVDVDTRADVYALGVLLYELLTGTTPLTREVVKRAALDEVLRLVREQEAPTPSSRVSTSDAAPSIAANRQTEPQKLNRFVQGELDWIVLKALAKDRDRRYESATSFARDVERFLAHEPVTAGPPSGWYKVRKFVRRHRGPVLAASLILFALLAGIAGTTLGFFEARHQGDIARDEAAAKEAARKDEAEQRELANAEKKKAQQAEDRAMETFRQSVNDGIEQLIGTKRELGPTEKAYITSTLERWKTFAGRVGNDERSAAVRGEAHYAIGGLWQRLGKRDEAKKEIETARDIYDKLASSNPGTLIYQVQLANIYHDLALLHEEADEFNSARTLLEKALRSQEKLVQGHQELPKLRLDLANTHTSMGNLHTRLHEYPFARREYEAARDIQLKLLAAQPGAPQYRQHLATTRGLLASVLGSLKEDESAEREFQAAVDLHAGLIKEMPYVPAFQDELAHVLLNFGSFEANRGRLQNAREHFDSARDLFKQLADFFPAINQYRILLGQVCAMLGKTYQDTGKPGEALPWYDAAIQHLTRAYERDRSDPGVRETLGKIYVNRAWTLRSLGKFAESAKDWDKAIEFASEADRPERRAARANMLVKVGRWQDAVTEVADLMKSPNWTADQRYNFACVYAVASGFATKASRPEGPRYAETAIDILKAARESKFMTVQHVANDTDLDPIRDRDDFKTLLAELKAKQPPKDAVPPTPEKK